MGTKIPILQILLKAQDFSDGACCDLFQGSIPEIIWWQEKHENVQYVIKLRLLFGASQAQILNISDQTDRLGKVPDSLKQNSTFRIWGSHSGGYEEYYLLGYNAM
jgi:hypothetical protein